MTAAQDILEGPPGIVFPKCPSTPTGPHPSLIPGHTPVTTPLSHAHTAQRRPLYLGALGQEGGGCRGGAATTSPSQARGAPHDALLGQHGPCGCGA
jgi:hypothetical protein